MLLPHGTEGAILYEVAHNNLLTVQTPGSWPERRLKVQCITVDASLHSSEDHEK